MRIPARFVARGLAAAAVLALAACSGTPAAPTPFPTAASSPAPGTSAGAAPRVLVTGLEVPWGVAFLPDGAALVTERESARLLRDGGRRAQRVVVSGIVKAGIHNGGAV